MVLEYLVAWVVLHMAETAVLAETVAQAAAIAKGRAPKGAVNARHWTRKALLRR